MLTFIFYQIYCIALCYIVFGVYLQDKSWNLISHTINVLFKLKQHTLFFVISL